MKISMSNPDHQLFGILCFAKVFRLLEMDPKTRAIFGISTKQVAVVIRRIQNPIRVPNV